MANGIALRQSWFGGARRVAEQMIGLDEALAECSGKSVLDLGCAEGAIALAFARAGASRVVGIECNAYSVKVALEFCGDLVRIEQGNLNTMRLPEGPWDIVLALAIIHKMRSPTNLIADIAGTGAALVVVRLPGGSSGTFQTKHYGTPCDVNAEFVRNGYVLGTALPGPQDELVQYWRRAE